MISERVTNEALVIGCILKGPQWLPDVLDIISAEDFTNPTYRAMFEAAVSLQGRDETVDSVTIKREAGSRGEYVEDRLIFDLLDITPTATVAPECARRLKSDADMARIREIVDTATAVNQPAGEAIDEIMAGLHSLERGSTRGKAESLSSAMSRLLDWSEQEDDQSIWTGYLRLDSVLCGMRPGNLVVLAARPGVGKSAFAADIALSTAKAGQKSAFFSCEMSELEIVQRMLAKRAHIPLNDIISKDFMRKEESAGNAANAANELSKIPMLIYDQPGITLQNIRRTLQTEKDIALVVVDYIQLMEPPEKRENQNLIIASLSRGLKILAKEFKVPIIALSQLNRGKDENDEPSLRDLRDSGAIEQDADTVILLWKLDTPDHGLQKVGVKVGKNRMGKTGTVVMNFDGAYMRFTETTETYVPRKKGWGRSFAPRDDDLPEGWT